MFSPSSFTSKVKTFLCLIPQLFLQRKDRHLDRGQLVVKMQHHPCVAVIQLFCSS
jgi:hypothetical protein